MNNTENLIFYQNNYIKDPVALHSESLKIQMFSWRQFSLKSL